MLRQENRDYKQQNSDLNQKVEELNSKLEEFNSSVGDEVPALIDQNAKLKAKLKAEQATVDRQQDEVQLLAFVLLIISKDLFFFPSAYW